MKATTSTPSKKMTMVSAGPHQKSRTKSTMMTMTPSRIFLCIGIVCFLWIDFQLSFSIEESASSSPQSKSKSTSKSPPQSKSTSKSKSQSKSTSQSQSQLSTKTSKVSQLGYIHIGKTGGSTISTLLRNGCHSFLPKPCRNIKNETVVSKLVDHYYHVPDFHSLPDSKDRSFVLSVRDVYDRTVSAFVYTLPSNIEHYGLAHKIGISTSVNDRRKSAALDRNRIRKNKVAYTCFPSLETFASLQRNGDSEQCNYQHSHEKIVMRNCTKLACAVIHGKVRYFNHLFFNYRNILRTKLPRAAPARKLYVIRQEFLWDDWARVNAMLGESEGVEEGVENNNNNNDDNNDNDDNDNDDDDNNDDDYNNDDDNNDDNDNDNNNGEIHKRDVSDFGEIVRNSRNLSETGRRQLCTALTNEYAAYFSILRRAENVNANEFEQARTIAMRNCPNLEFLSSAPFEPTELENKELWEPEPATTTPAEEDLDSAEEEDSEEDSE